MTVVSDIKAKRVTETGALSVGRSRIRGVTITASAGACRFTITSGNGGETLLDLDVVASTTLHVFLPQDGIISAADPYVSAATNIVAATIYYA